MKTKVQKIFFVILFSVISLLWAESGGKNQLYAVKTDFFEIIYPKACEKSAEILFENADKIFSEVLAQYEIDCNTGRMPVVLTPSVDSFNAFWTSAPYNHIVIYDTSFSVESELSVFSETLLKTFRHELTHAVTFNMNNSFWTGVKNIFGDSVNPASLWIASGMAEGATLTSESADGEGRLNDEFAKHPVKQAKIENLFPSYYDVTGAADKYPSGAFYYFNGAFHQWLQENYGMEKYAQFWYKLVNMQALTVGIAFKNVYDVELKRAWNSFKNDYKIPDIPANPLETGFVEDFFNSNNDSFSSINNSGSHFVSLTKSKKGIAWIDSYGGKINYVPLSHENSSFETLFSLKGVQKISLSQDGKFMALSYFVEGKNGTSARVKLYDIENKKFYSAKKSGIKDAAIIQKGMQYFLVGTIFKNAKNAIYIEEIDFSGKSSRFLDGKNAKIIELPLNVAVSSFVQTDSKNGIFACIKKNRLEYSIELCDLNGKSLQEYKMPVQRMTVRSLSFEPDYESDYEPDFESDYETNYKSDFESDTFGLFENSNAKFGGKFYFSWACSDTMPRLGMLDISQNKMTLSGTKGDISGGIFEPIFVNSGIAYLAQFYRFSSILKISSLNDFLAETDSKIYDLNVLPNFQEIQNNSNIFDKALFEDLPDEEKKFAEKKYNPFKYMFKGIFIPFSDYSQELFGYNAYETSTADYIWGATFITGAPWSDGTNSLYSSSIGYDALRGALGVKISGQFGKNPNFFLSAFELKSEFDLTQKGWKNSAATFVSQLTLPVGNVSTVTFLNQVKGAFGYQDDLSKNLLSFFSDSKTESSYKKNLPPPETIYYSALDIFSATISTVNKAGPGRYEKSGFAYSLGVGYRFDSDFSPSPCVYVNTIQILQELKVYIPHILSYSSPYGKTTNFPAVLNLSVFPAQPKYLSTSKYKNFGKSLFDFETEVMCFAMEIQKAIPFFQAFFMNDFSVSAGYLCSAAFGSPLETSVLKEYANLGVYADSLFKGNFAYLDSVFAKASFSITPNLGALAKSSAKSDLYLKYYYNLRKSLLSDENSANSFFIEIGFSSSF